MNKKQWANIGISSQERDALSRAEREAQNRAKAINPFTGETRWLTPDEWDIAYPPRAQADFSGFVKKFKAEQKRIEREKNKKERKQKAIKAKKEKRLIEKRVSDYKKLTGKKRISKTEREFLKIETAKKVYEQKNTAKEKIEKRLKRRISNYEERYGKASEEAKLLLRVATPAKVAKYEGTYDITIGDIPYEAFAEKARYWSHSSGSWMYNHSAWDGINVESILSEGPDTGGGDMNNLQVLTEILRVSRPEYEIEIKDNRSWKIVRSKA